MSITTRGNPRYNTEFFRATARMGLSLAFASLLFLPSFAQNLTVDGAVMSVESGASVTAVGGVTIQNAGGADNAGTIQLSGDWTNNANGLVNASAGTVVLDGGNQTIGGSNATTFHNLTLQGTGVKSLAVNASVSSVLALNDRELATGANSVFVNSTSTGAITFTAGFISSATGGAAYRNMAASSTYVFPVGVAGKFRPVDVTPSVASAHTYGVRMVNNDPNANGFSRSVNDGNQCLINDQFFHLISRTSGSSPADVGLYYATGDGPFNSSVHWQGLPRWETMAPTTAGSGYGLNSRVKAGWNDFSTPAFALSKTAVTVSCPSNRTVFPGYPGNTCTTLTMSGIGGGSGTGYVLQWIDGSTGLVVGTGASVTVCPTSSRCYIAKVTDSEGCMATCTTRVCVVNADCSNNGNNPKVLICHVPPGNPGNAHTICVSVNAISSHVGAHGGDYIGPCRANPEACTGGCTGTKTEDDRLSDNMPNAMLDAYPNPFSNTTTLRFRFDSDENVSLQVFSLTGQLVSKVYIGAVEAGTIYEKEFRPEDLSGGMYIAKLVTDSGISLSRKLVFAK